MNTAHSVLIVEDQHDTRERLASVVSSHPDLKLVGSAATIQQGRELLNSAKPEILLTDLNLPDGNGLDLIRDASSSATESMVITVFCDEKHVIDALQAGASGYLLKDCNAVDVGNAIRQVLDGGSPISPYIARYLLKVFRTKRKNPDLSNDRVDDPLMQDACVENEITPLTKREYEVLRLIAKGFTYQEIAETLGISVHTITTHTKHIYRKLAVGSRGEAVYEATKIGLL